MIQLEKALRRYIAQVRDGEHASSIISTVSLSSATTTTSQDQWKLIQQELKSVGITAAQLNAYRETVIDILRDAFPESDALASPSVKIKKAGQMSRLLSTLNGGRSGLRTAAAIQDVKNVIMLLVSPGRRFDIVIAAACAFNSVRGGDAASVYSTI